MHRHILIPVALDHEAIVDRKIALARHLLDEGGQITLLTVLEQLPGFVSEFVDMKPENHLTQKVKGKLDDIAAGAPDIKSEVVLGKPGLRIAGYAEENGVDLIIIGSHLPGLQDYFLGSTAARVVRRAPCAVYVLR
jgi:nucleotide-binding universal stress UspA family protein